MARPPLFRKFYFLVVMGEEISVCVGCDTNFRRREDSQKSGDSPWASSCSRFFTQPAKYQPRTDNADSELERDGKLICAALENRLTNKSFRNNSFSQDFNTFN
jgi:hypothetical protein